MKRIRLFALPLLLCLLLPLIAGCAQKPTYATAAPTIPEGWEAVSTDGAITHLQMKEGSDAYHWVEDLAYHQLNQESTIVTDLQIAGNEEKAPLKPDQDGNVYFILYFGQFYAKKIDGVYKLVEPTQEPRELDVTLRIQYLGSGDIFGNTSEYDFLSERWALDELEQYNNVSFIPTGNHYYDDPQAHVGLTQAVMVPIPYEKLATVAEDWTTLVFHTYSATMGHTLAEAQQPCLTYKDNVYFRADDVEFTENPLFTDWVGIISLILLACSLIVMILTAVFKKNCFLHLIPILLGVIYNIIALCYQNSIPYSPALRGQGVGEILLIGLLVFTGIVLLALRLLIGLVRKAVENIRQKDE